MFILLIFFLIETNATINPHGPTIINDYTNCIIQLIEQNFRKPGLLIFANTDNVSTSVTRIRGEVLKHIHQSTRYSVQVFSPENEVEICSKEDNSHISLLHIDVFEAIPRADYFVIIVDIFNDLKLVLGKLIRSRSWDPHAKFILLLFNYVPNDQTNVEYVEHIFTCLFRYNVVNIVLIVPIEKKIRKSFVYGWRPYDPPTYCGYYNETAKNRLIKENICEKGIVKYQRGVFPNRVPANMEGCVLYILALERQPFVSVDEDEANIEKYLMNELLKSFKLKPHYEIINDVRGEKLSGEWNGALKELTERRGNVLLGGIFPDNEIHEDFECSFSYFADSYTWVVPKAYPSPRWVPLIIIFEKIVWMSVICVFIICGLTWTILGQISNDTKYNRTAFHCFLSTWICSLGFGTYFRPSKECLRVFFVFFNLYCILCLTAYQTKLIDVLRNPTFQYQIKTMEELVLSGLKFGGYEELRDLFQNSSDPFDYLLGERWISIGDISKAMIDVAVHRNFSLLCSRLELAHITANIPELSDNFGSFKYYAFATDVFTVPMEMVAMKGFAFMNEFSKTLDVMKQSGVNVGIRKYFTSLNNLKRANLLRSIQKSRPDIDALTIQHLQGGFLALSLGYVLGIFSLLMEIVANSQLLKDKISQCKACFKRD